MKNQERLKNRLKDLREDRDLTQDQLVELLKMNKTTYTRYEQGICDLPLEFAKQMAIFYNVSLDYLSGLTPTPRALNGEPYKISKNINITNKGGNNKINIKQ